MHIDDRTANNWPGSLNQRSVTICYQLQLWTLQNSKPTVALCSNLRYGPIVIFSWVARYVTLQCVYFIQPYLKKKLKARSVVGQKRRVGSCSANLYDQSWESNSCLITISDYGYVAFPVSIILGSFVIIAWMISIYKTFNICDMYTY